MNSKDLNRLARDPVAMMKFQATGKFTQPQKPSSPLIDLLMSLHPRERIRIEDVRMHPDLGYRQGATFFNAGTALNWLSPPNHGGSIPSESHKLASFTTVLTLDDLAKHATVPQDILESWNRRNRRPPGKTQVPDSVDPAP